MQKLEIINKKSNPIDILKRIIEKYKTKYSETERTTEQETQDRSFEFIYKDGIEYVKFFDIERPIQEKRKEYENYLESAGLFSQKDLTLDTIDNYIFLENQNANPNNLYLKIKQNKSLVLSGPPGTGKTTLACALIKEFFEEEKTIIIKRWYHWLVKMRGVYQNDDIRDMEQFLRPAVKSDLLLLDELGTDKKSTATPFEQEQLMYIISERHGNSKPTIVTTNLIREEILSIYGESIYQRLADQNTGFWFEFDNEKIRRKIIGIDKYR